MDTRTGNIHRYWNNIPEEDREYCIEVEPQNLTPEQLKRGKVYRNDPCPCGSGYKFKKCCKSST